MIQQSTFEVAHEGMTIRGSVYRPPGEGRHPTVLMLHGFTGHRIETGFLFVSIARALAEKGIAAVTFDFRHSGESDGSFEQMLVTGELSDTLRMTDWVRHQPFVDRTRVGLLGMSLGGLLAACTSARAGGFKTLTLLCPTDVENIVNNVCKRNAGCPADAPIIAGPFTLNGDFSKDMATLDPVADVVKTVRPTLLIHGTGDKTVPPAIAQRYIDALHQSGMPYSVEWIPDADHGFSSPAFRQRLRDVVVNWNARQLK